MKIAVNTRLLVRNKLDGIGYFIFESLQIITRNHPEHEFYFFFDRDFDEDFIFSDNVTPIIIGPQARHPFLYFIWFELSIPSLLNRLKIDLFLSPDGYLSLRSKIPSIAIFHDLNFEHHPQDYPYLERKYYRFFFPRFAKKANRIATVSEYSKNDIIEKYHIKKEKIDVVYCAARPIFQPIKPAEKEEVKQIFSEGNDFFIYVGSIQPRKNLSVLIKAFDLYKEKTSSKDKLLFVGALKWNSSELRDAYKSSAYKQDIHFTGRLDSNDLAKVTASAKALMLISKLEGFGIPILEAYFCDVPVITSNVTSMPEIAGDGALLVNPESIESVAKAMIEMDRDILLRDKLIKNAQIQRRKFSWQKTADLMWDGIEKTVNT
ncbi:MAG: glycosyltransferase family 4 protein [Bacteroidetes bacterium]|nr:glycosyltransferase family 4 protein [Bacteroidota bacterium]